MKKRPIALPPLPEGVTAEDIGRVVVRQVKPIRPELVVNVRRNKSRRVKDLESSPK